MEIAIGGVGDGERLYSPNLGDFLRIKEEDHQRNLNQSASSTSGGGGRRSSSGLTLSAVLSDKGEFPPPPLDEQPPLQRVQSNRTLLDIIREDQTSGLGRGREDGRSSWRHLRDKIRLRCRGGAVPNNNNRFSSQHHSNRFNSVVDSTQQPLGASGRFEQPDSLPARRSVTEDNRQGSAEDDGAGEEQPVRMSLMALLAENDRQMGYESSAYMMDEKEEEGDVAVKGVDYNNCCVCMVRHKGAAFIPCGHTFCRLCSRELWVQRGNCPLCNNHILEILDIF